MKLPLVKKIVFISLGLLFVVTTLFGQNYPKKPLKATYVNDFAEIINDNFEAELNTSLEKFYFKSSNQIVYITINSLDGMSISQYATELAEKWAIGSKENDNGVLVLIKPKKPNEKGEVFIAVGYGLEGAIPDAIAKTIIDNDIIPEFKKGNIEQGILKSANALTKLSVGEYNIESYNKANKKNKTNKSSTLVVLIVIALIVFIIFKKGGKNRGGGSGIGEAIFWGTIASMMSSGGSGRSSGFGGGSGFGGSSFGGGSFGGGGASGSW